MSDVDAEIAQRDETQRRRRRAKAKNVTSIRARNEAIDRRIEAVAVTWDTATSVRVEGSGLVVTYRDAEIEVDRLASVSPAAGDRVALLVAGAYFVAIGVLPPDDQTDEQEA